MNNRSYEGSSETGQVPLTSFSLRIFDYAVEVPIIWNIFGSHARRIGIWRTFFGGISMYLSIPFFVILHVTGLVLVFRLVLTPLFQLERLPLGNYIIIDRHKIAGLTFMDKLNCMFCGYANGMLHYLNTWLDLVAVREREITTGRKAVAVLLLAVYLPFIAMLQWFCLHIVYELLVAGILMLPSMSEAQALQKLNSMNAYAGAGRLLKTQKIFALRFGFALAQIESGWCPLKHLDKRAEASYPEHHENFFEPHQLDEMRVQLVERGTICDRD